MIRAFAEQCKLKNLLKNIAWPINRWSKALASNPPSKLKKPREHRGFCLCLPGEKFYYLPYGAKVSCSALGRQKNYQN